MKLFCSHDYDTLSVRRGLWFYATLACSRCGRTHSLADEDAAQVYGWLLQKRASKRVLDDFLHKYDKDFVSWGLYDEQC